MTVCGPADLLLLHAVRLFIESPLPVIIEALQTEVSSGRSRKFTWVWLPQIRIKALPDSVITLALSPDHYVVHDRIRQAVEPYRGRWTNHVVTSQESDLDADVKSWLSEAYTFGRPQTGLVPESWRN